MENCEVSDSMQLMKFHVLTSDVARYLVQSDTGAGSFHLPFDMSAEEAKIVSHGKSSAIIVGRSGTGKTTAMLNRVFKEQREFKLTAKSLELTS